MVATVNKGKISKRSLVRNKNNRVYQLHPVNHFHKGTHVANFHKFDQNLLKAVEDKFTASNCSGCACSASLPTLSYTIDIDLRGKCERIYDQGQLGSCTANAGSLMYSMICNSAYFPSRLFIYYNERVIENTVSSDTGAPISYLLTTMNNTGVAPESDWAYDISKYKEQPSANSYTDALKCKINSYKQIQQGLAELIAALHSGLPFVFGFNVGNTFMNETGSTGFLTTKDSSFSGSHCVTCVGYCSSQKCFLIANSWGTDWGFSGYFLMSEDLLLDASFASSFYTIA